MGTGPAASRKVTDRSDRFAHIEPSAILGPLSASYKRTMFLPLAAPLSLEPVNNGLPVIPPVAPQLETGHPPRPRLCPNPGLGNRETFRDFAGREETLRHAAVLSPTTNLCRA
jgi:hypothetical protein